MPHDYYYITLAKHILERKLLMKVNRRSFFLTLGAGGLIGSTLGLDLTQSRAYAATAKTTKGKITTTICPYCGCGCGVLVTASKGRIINVEGDPDHPVNEGALCSKGAAMYQIANNENRLTKVKYRAPNSTKWEEKDWDWAIDRIAANIKATRDRTFVEKDENNNVVNRNEGMACMGGAALDNEECYAYSKLARTLGVVYLEHQARI